MWANVKSGTNLIETRQLEPGALVVGRDAECDLTIDDERVSRVHARLWISPNGSVEVEDSDSTNGTYLNGARVSGRTGVRVGDEIRIGRHVLQIAAAPGHPGQQTVIESAAFGQAGAQAPYAPPQPPVQGAPFAPAPAAARAPYTPPQPPAQTPYAPPWTPAPAQPAARAPYAPPSPLAQAPYAPLPPGTPGQPFTPPAAGTPGQPFGAQAPQAGTGGSGGRRRRNPKLALAAVAVVAAAAVAAGVTLIPKIGGDPVLSAAQLSKKWGPSTLYIQANIKGQAIGSGTAWVYNAKEGLVVTNAHVVNAGNEYQIGTGANRQTAQLVGVSVCDDLAVLKVPNLHGLPQFQLGSQSQVQQGETTVALGYPGNVSKTPNLSETTGVVSVTRTSFQLQGVETPNYPDVIQTTAPINPGNSGGPLLDDHGHLIGINTATLQEDAGGESVQNEGYAIGVDHAKTVLTQLAKGNSVGFTGMKLDFPTQNSDFKNFNLPVVKGGIIVYAADAHSPAAKASFGVVPVVISAINGHPLDGTISSYCSIVGNFHKGQTATFRATIPGGKVFNVPVGFE
jgi:S1-C subfamily serine protease